MNLKRKQTLPRVLRAAPALACTLLWLASSDSVAQTPLTGIARIAGGVYHTCAVTSGGGVKCWGLNDEGQIGDNSITPRLTPVDVLGLSAGMGDITAGPKTSCALTTGGGIKCWGYNGNGELGDTTRTRHLTAVDIPGLSSGMSAVALGQWHACARTNSGGAKCWGDNGSKQQGNLTINQLYVPGDVLTTPATPLSGASALTAGGFHNCVIVGGGGVTCWGNNGYGQLGNGQSGQPADAVTVIAGPMQPPIAGITALTAGTYHTCALNSTGGVQCWGRNDFGQLGTSAPITNSTWPIDVDGLASGVTAIAAGDRHTCALVSGTVKCWGWNFAGQLGNNSNTNSTVPVDVTGLMNATAIAAGGFHTCAIMGNTGVKCWGYNVNGQLGNNSNSASSIPVDVLTIPPAILGGVVSRKLHDTAGTFDLPVNRLALITGAVTVEPRVLGPIHAIVFYFDGGPVTIPGTATAVNGTGGGIMTGSPTIVAGNGISVNLFAINDNSRATITLTGVNGNVNASASIGFLMGDVNNSRAVDAGDLTAVKARSGQPVDQTNFQFDVNTTGIVTVADILAVKARSGTALGL